KGLSESAGGVPDSVTRPALGCSRPPRMPSRVLFPQPDGPISATVSPSAMSRSMLSRAATGPYWCETRSTCSGIACHCNQHGAIGDLLAFLHRDRFDAGIQRRLELVLDLHRLQHDQSLAAHYLVAGCNFDRDDPAVHRRAQLAVATRRRRGRRHVGAVVETHGEALEIDDDVVAVYDVRHRWGGGLAELQRAFLVADG